MKKNYKNALLKNCPSCKKKSYVVSIFGSICGNCDYKPCELSYDIGCANINCIDCNKK